MLSLAFKSLKPGAYVFSSIMTRIGALIYGLKHNPAGILYQDRAKKLWETGTDDKFVEATEYFTHAYFSQPEETNPLIESVGLKPLHMVGAGERFGERFELFHSLKKEQKAAWLDLVIDNCEDKHRV